MSAAPTAAVEPAPRRAPRRRRRRAAIAALTVVLAVVAALVVVELVLRITDRSPQRFVYDPAVGYINRPHAEFTFNSMHVSTGADGRIASPVAGTSDRPDLLVVGDSYAAGQCASWPGGCIEVATTILAEAKPGFTTVNLGTSGYGTDQCLLRLRPFLGPRPPRVVMYVMFDNDLHDNFDHFHFGLLKPRFELRAGEAVQVDGASAVNALVLDLKLGGLIAGRFVRPQTHMTAWRGHPAQERAALALALIREMKRACDEAGSRFVIAAHYLATLDAPEEDFAILLRELRDAGFEVRLLNERVDLRSHYDAACWHWDAEGHRLVGRELAAWLSGTAPP